MKPLFWKRIQVDLVKHEKAHNLSKLFREDLQEAVLDLDEFDHLFSKSPIQLKKKGKVSKASVKSVQVLDAKRSQAVGILLSTIRLEMTAIQHGTWFWLSVFQLLRSVTLSAMLSCPAADQFTDRQTTMI